MLRTRLVAIAILVGGVLLALAATLIPPPAKLPEGYPFQTTLALLVLNTCLNWGAVGLFLMGLAGLKTAFRKAYYWICIGFLIQSVGAFIYMLAIYTGAVHDAWMTLVAEIPLAFGNVVIFWGWTKFARLLRVSRWSSNILAVGLPLVILALLLWIAPHGSRQSGGEFVFDLGHAIFITEIFFYVVCSILVVNIRSVANVIYRSYLRWFLLAALTAFLANVLLLGADFFTYPDWLTEDNLSLFFIFTNFLSVVAAYSFNKITKGVVKIQPTDSSLVDSITFLSSLVSKPSDIEPTLDRLRGITATHKSNMPFTTTEKEALEHIRKELEDYLVDKEQLRSFDRKSLNDLLQERNLATLG